VPDPGLEPDELKFTLNGASPIVGDALANATGGPDGAAVVVVVVDPGPDPGGVEHAAAINPNTTNTTNPTERQRPM